MIIYLIILKSKSLINKLTLYIVLSVVVVLALIFSFTFEWKEVPDIDWKGKHQFTNDQPYGTSLFLDLVKESYGEDNVHIIKNIEPYIDVDGQSLYIFFGEEAQLEQEQSNVLDSLLNRGNQVIIIANIIALNQFSKSGSFLYSSSTMDSIINISALDTAKNSISYSYKNYLYDFDHAKLASFYHLQELIDTDSTFIADLQFSDSLCFYARSLHPNIALSLHSIPSLFNNSAALQPFYLDHFNYVFSGRRVKNVYLAYSDIVFTNSSLSKSPLQFILASRGLKWAYYLLLFSALLLFIMGGKRKQKIIETIVEKENTSLEFVDTLSRLFQKQNQNEKLVRHMEKIYYFNISSKYFLTQKQDNFVFLLSQKSKIEENIIQKIVDHFNSLDQRRSYSDELLFRTYNQLNTFYKKAK